MTHLSSPDVDRTTPGQGLFRSPKAFYRTMAIAEAITWTLLIAGMLLKYVAEAGDLGVRIGGFLHGLVFLGYAMTAVLVGLHQRWGVALTALTAATAVVPYATIPVDRWLDRRGRLEGGWRREATADPRDSTPVNRLLRWALNHPVLLAIAFMVVLAAIMTILLVIGPPGR